jgi:hypothetical protein
MSTVMLLIPRRTQLAEAEARELIKRLELGTDERAASNAISRIRFALTDSQEQTLTRARRPPSTPSSPPGSLKTLQKTRRPGPGSRNFNAPPPRSELLAAARFSRPGRFECS